MASNNNPPKLGDQSASFRCRIHNITATIIFADTQTHYAAPPRTVLTRLSPLYPKAPSSAFVSLMHAVFATKEEFILVTFFCCRQSISQVERNEHSKHAIAKFFGRNDF